MTTLAASPVIVQRASTFPGDILLSPSRATTSAARIERRFTTPPRSPERAPRTPNPNRGHFQPYSIPSPTSPASPSRSSSSQQCKDDGILPDLPADNDPDAEFIRAPFDDALNYMSVVSASGPSKFLDARDFILDGKVVQEYPYRLEPVRGLGGLKDGPLMEDDCLRCTFCRKKYRGKNSKSMWRRHVQKSHKIKLKNFRERNKEHEAFQQTKRSELREKRQQSQQANEREPSHPMPLPYPPPPAYPISRMPLAETPVSHNLVIIPHFKTPLVKPGVFEESIHAPAPTPVATKKRPKPSSKTAKENALGSKSRAKRATQTASATDAEAIQLIAASSTNTTDAAYASVQDLSPLQSPVTSTISWSPSATALKRSSSAQALTLLSPIDGFVSGEALEHIARETMPFFAPPLAPASLLASPSDVHGIDYMQSSSIDDDLDSVAQSTSHISVPYSSSDESGDEWFVEYECRSDSTAALESDAGTSATLPPTAGLGFDMSLFFGSSSSMDVLEDYSEPTAEEIDVDQWLAFDSDDEEDDAMVSPTAISATS